MLDQRGQLLRAALGFAGCSLPPYDRALWALRTWLDSRRRRLQCAAMIDVNRALLCAVSLCLVSCASTLPTGRISYVTEITNPETPSIHAFMLAQDLPGCEAAISTAPAEFITKKYAQKVEFGRCREAVLEIGSDYWAVATNLIPGNPVVMGSSVKRFCESTAQQFVNGLTRCSPTNVRFIRP